MLRLAFNDPLVPTLFEKAELAPLRKLDRIKRGHTRGGGWHSGRERAPRQTCLACGSLFYAPPVQFRRGGGKYCSHKCFGTSLTTADHYRTCRLCSNKFSVEVNSTVKVCPSCVDARAALLASKPVVIAKCKTCGRETAGTSFCNAACYHAHRAANKVQPWHTRPESANSTCRTCGNRFYASPTQKRSGWGLYCSRACKPLPSYTSGVGGTRPDLGFYLRSTWEANYARYLKWLQANGQIKAWEYEPITYYFEQVKRGTRSYTPDFRVTENDGSQIFHEVKGYMDDKSRVKLKRMAIYYPQHKIILIENKQMREIKAKVAAIIPHWEYGKNDKLGKRRAA